METSEKIEKISKEKLLNLLLNFEKEICFSGCSFAFVNYFTDESGSRTVNKEKVLQKSVTTQITVGSSYEKRINRDLVKQGEDDNFTAQQMSGKEHISSLIVQATKNPDNKMLCCVVEHHIKPETKYFYKGNEISFEDAKAQDLFSPSFFTPKDTSGRGLMSVERDFHFFTLGLDKIRFLKVGGIKYIIEN